MEIHNFLPVFLDCLKRWKEPPPAEIFVKEYYARIEALAGVMLDDFGYEPGGADFHTALAELDWKAYRDEALKLDPVLEEKRVRTQLSAVEGFFGVKPEGEVVLFSSFALMDGYARFDRGKHRVFLAADESHGRGRYLDVLYAHELTHVIRESRASVWEGFGLDPKMSHDAFRENQPVIEHLFSEGFSCAVSEILVPGGPPGGYAYQTDESLALVLENAGAVNDAVHRELARGDDGDYAQLYAAGRSGPASSPYAHYVWAWQWVKRLIADKGAGDARRLVTISSKAFREHALAFRLEARDF